MKTGKTLSLLPFLFTVLISYSLSLLHCSQSSIAGGVEVGNPITVSGIVVDHLLKPVCNATVLLTRPGFIPVSDSSVTLNYQSHTDSTGAYFLKTITQGIYNLNIADPVSRSISLHSHISLERDTVLSAITLYDPGLGVVSVADSVFQQESFLYVPGTPLRMNIPRPGIYLFAVPYDTISIHYYSLKTGADISLSGNTTEAVFIAPRDTVDLTGIENYVVSPVLYAQYDTVKYQLPLIDTIITGLNVYIFADGAYCKKGHPLEYQFYFRLPGSDTGFSQWSTGNYSMIKDSVDIIYIIAARARSNVDKAILSDWSREYTIVIDRPDEE